MERGEFGCYPETKTPVAKRKTKGSTALNTSPVWPELTVKGLGSGALKSTGAANDTDDDEDDDEDEDEAEASEIGSCWVEVEEVSDMALMQTLLLGNLLLGNEIGL